MAVRSLIRDLIVVYLSYEVIKGYISHTVTVNTNILIAVVLLLLITIWFLLEKIGLLPKLT